MVRILDLVRLEETIELLLLILLLLFVSEKVCGPTQRSSGMPDGSRPRSLLST